MLSHDFTLELLDFAIGPWTVILVEQLGLVEVYDLHLDIGQIVGYLNSRLVTGEWTLFD